MTYRLNHEWIDGPRIASAQLSTCRHCGTLRTVDHSWSTPRPTTYTRAGIKEEADRVREDEVPCLAPQPSQASVASRRAEGERVARAAAVAEAIERAPEDEPEPPRAAAALLEGGPFEARIAGVTLRGVVDFLDPPWVHWHTADGSLRATRVGVLK